MINKLEFSKNSGDFKKAEEEEEGEEEGEENQEVPNLSRMSHSPNHKLLSSLKKGLL